MSIRHRRERNTTRPEFYKVCPITNNRVDIVTGKFTVGDNQGIVFVQGAREVEINFVYLPVLH